MTINQKIAAVAASPFLFAGAAFAGPYVNLEATGSYPDGAYSSGGLEAVIGYLGGSYDKFYGEISGVTADEDVDWSAKAGVKFTF